MALLEDEGINNIAIFEAVIGTYTNLILVTSYCQEQKRDRFLLSS